MSRIFRDSLISYFAVYYNGWEILRDSLKNGSVKPSKNPRSKKAEKSFEISAFLFFSRSDLNRPKDLAGAEGLEPYSNRKRLEVGFSPLPALPKTKVWSSTKCIGMGEEKGSNLIPTASGWRTVSRLL